MINKYRINIKTLQLSNIKIFTFLTALFIKQVIILIKILASTTHKTQAEIKSSLKNIIVSFVAQ